MWFVPFVLVVLLPGCPTGKYTQPIIFGDTVMIGMPPPPYWQNRPLKKFTCAWAGGKFSELGEEAFVSKQSACPRAGESIASWLCAHSSCFSPGRPQYCARGQRCRIKSSLGVLGKALGGKKRADFWFVRANVLLCVHNLWQYSMPILMLQTNLIRLTLTCLHRKC